MSEKRDLKRAVKARRIAAEAVVYPQWRHCFWTRPFGHIRDGQRSVSDNFADVCHYCGKPGWGSRSVRELEESAERAHLFPIAHGHAKDSVRA